MYEIMELFKDDNYQSRTVPIILSDFDAYDIESKLKYIGYWNNCKREIEIKMKEIDIESIGTLQDDLRMLRNITNTIDDFIDYIQDNNCISYRELKKPILKSFLNRWILIIHL